MSLTLVVSHTGATTHGHDGPNGWSSAWRAYSSRPHNLRSPVPARSAARQSITPIGRTALLRGPRRPRRHLSRRSSLGVRHGCLGRAAGRAFQWWEIVTNTWQVSQLGRIDDASGANFYAFPTIAANREGDVLLGFAQFSASTHPSASFAIKKSGGALQGPHVFAPGRATYFETFSGTKNRWGDYSATIVDPDNCHLGPWSFADMPANTWATMWARISPPGTV